MPSINGLSDLLFAVFLIFGLIFFLNFHTPVNRDANQARMRRAQKQGAGKKFIRGKSCKGIETKIKTRFKATKRSAPGGTKSGKKVSGANGAERKKMKRESKRKEAVSKGGKAQEFKTSEKDSTQEDFDRRNKQWSDSIKAYSNKRHAEEQVKREIDNMFMWTHTPVG